MAGRKGSAFPTITPTSSMFVFGYDSGEAVESLQNVTFLVSNFNPWTRNSTSGFIFPSTLTDFVGVGTITPLAILNSLSTSEQLRLSYDVTNFTSFTVSSGGDLTIAPSGADTSITGSLTVVSTTSGFLPPVLTDTQRDAISSPASGLMIYDITNNDYNFYDGTSWRAVLDASVASFTAGGIAFGSTNSDHSLTNSPDDFFWDDTNKRLGVGTAVIPKGGLGGAKLAIEGTDNSLSAGPYVQYTTSADVFPLIQIAPHTHDDISINFDSYWNGTTYSSSDIGSNYQIVKFEDIFEINYDSGIAAGSSLGSMNIGISLNTSGFVGIGHNAPLALLNPLSTSEQLRLSYNTTNFASFTVNSTGDLTIIPTGANLSFTASLDVSNGTELLPSYAFTGSASTGMRYDSSTPALAFSLTGQDVLKLTSPGDNFLKIVTDDSIEDEEFIQLIPDGTDTNVSLNLNGKNGSVNINTGSGDGEVFIGENDTIEVSNTGSISIGTQSNLGPSNTDGNVLLLGAKTTFTKTKIVIRSPANSQDFDIGMNNVAVDSGSAFLENKGNTEMRFINTAGTAISISSLDTGFGVTAPSAKVHVLGTTEQLRLGYNASNYTSFTMDIGGALSTASYDSMSFSITSEEPTPRGFTFNSDGTKMYVIGQANDTVFQYTLSTGFDMSTASYDTVSLDISGQETTPRTITFNTAGTKMFILGTNSGSVRQYTLTTPDDLSTASFDTVSFSITNEDSIPQSLVFNDDGTKMWMLGDNNNTVYQYTLSTANQVSTASYDSVSFDVSSEDVQPQSIRFNSNFTKLYMVGDNTNTVYQYSLSTAEDLSTASYDNISFSVNSEETTPRSINFNSDETKMYILGNNMDTVFQYTLSSSLTISPTSKHTIILGDTIIAGDVTVNTDVLVTGDLDDDGNARVSSTSQLYSSVSNDGRNSGVFVEGATIASIGLKETNASTSQGLWDMRVADSGQYQIRLRNDASNLDVDGMVIVSDGALSIGSVRFPSGTASFGFSTTTTSQMEVRSSSVDQLRLAYDATNFTKFTTDSSGELTITPNSTLTVEGNLSVDDAIMSPFGGLGRIQNLLAYSEDMSQTSVWTDPLSATTVTSNNVTAPNGETTADTVTWNGVSVLGLRQINLTLIASTEYTLSFWAQAASGTETVIFDLGDGTSSDTVSIDTTMRRYVVQITSNSGSPSALDVNAGSTTAVINFWGWQLVLGSDPMPYVRTDANKHEEDIFGETVAGFLRINSGEDDPDGTETGTGGDIFGSVNGTLSKLFFNKEATTGTNWEGISLIPTNVHELFSTAEYEDLGTSSIITTGAITRQLNFKTTVTSSTRHVISDQDSELQFVDETEGNQMIYTGTSTFITATAGGDITLRNAALIAAIQGTQLFDYAGEANLPGVDINEVVQSSNIIQWNLGNIDRLSTGEAGPVIRFQNTNIISSTAPLVLDTPVILEVTSCLFEDSAEVGSGGPLFSIKNTGYKEGRAVFLTNGGILYSGESLIRIDAGVPSDYRVEVIDSTFIIRSGGSIFDTSGSTGTFTAVADASISATTITGVTDSSGVASFTHAGTTPPLGSLVTVSGFTTNTGYNTTGIVTASTSTTFEVDYVAFGTTETGSYLVNQVTITSTAHGLTQSTGVTLDTTESVDYDGGVLIYSILTNSFNVPGTFTSTNTGTWSTEGLDQVDPRVRAFNNPGTVDSRTEAFGNANANSTSTSVTDGTYAVFNISTISQDSSITEGFKITNTTNGVWTLTSLDEFHGMYSGIIWALKSGSTSNYRLAISINGAIPTFATANYAPMEIKTTKVSTPFRFPLDLTKGDTIQLMIAGDGTGDSLTLTDMQDGIQ